MANKYLDSNGVTYLWEKIKALILSEKVTVDAALSSTSTNPVQNKEVKAALDNKVDKVNGKGLSTNDYTTAEKEKLAGIDVGADVNQNAFSKVAVDGTATIVEADTESDTLTFIGGSNVTITPNAANDSITITATDTSYEKMSQTEATAGAAETPRTIDAKVLATTIQNKIDALDGGTIGTPGAGKTITALSQTNGNVSATFGNISITKSQVSDFPSLATVATSGDYEDLSNTPTIPTITDTYSGTSSNGMSGKAVKSAIDALDGTISGSPDAGKTLTALSQTDGKVSATFGDIAIQKTQVIGLGPATSLNEGLMSSSDYSKLRDIETGAEVNVQADWNETDPTSDAYIQNKPTIPPGVTVDSAISATSVNPVQNKVIKAALDDKVNTSEGNLSIEYMTSDGQVRIGGQNGFVYAGGGSSSLVGYDSTTGELLYLTLADGGLSLIMGQYAPLVISAINGNVELTGIVTPTSNTMAANKKYVDDSISGIPSASASANGLMSSSDYSKLAALPTNANLQSTYATKAEIVNMYKYRGSVADEDSLPTTDLTAGDVYNIVAASSYGGPGANVAWTGTAWDSLGEIFSIASMSNSDIDAAIADAA